MYNKIDPKIINESLNIAAITIQDSIKPSNPNAKNTLINKALSAIGSKMRPKLVSNLNLFAIYPSSPSVKQQNINIKKVNS